MAFARAGDAIAAAVGAQSALARESRPADAAIGVRMGCTPARFNERHGNSFGSTVSRAARLMALAHGGQMVPSAARSAVAVDDTHVSKARLSRVHEGDAHVERGSTRPETHSRPGRPRARTSYDVMGAGDVVGLRGRRNRDLRPWWRPTLAGYVHSQSR